MDHPSAARGGHKQRRLSADQHSEPAPDDDVTASDLSPLGMCLLDKWSWGVLSAPAVQEMAQAAKLNGCRQPDILFMASAGTHGQHQGNVHRDLMKKYCKDMVVPEVYITEIPFKVLDEDSGDMTVQHLDCHMLLPHDWLASLDRAGCLQSHWGTDRVAAFWRAQKANNPKLFQNPVTEVKDFDKVFIPLLLHGDGARYGERTSVMVYTVRSILSLLSVNDSQLLLAAVPKRCRATGASDTWDAIWRHLVWSFQAAFEGRHPQLTFDGQPFAQGSLRQELAGKSLCPNTGLRGIIWVISGDMEHLANELKCPHPSSNQPCGKCRANVTTLPFSDFRPAAKWKATRPSPLESRASPPSAHIIMTVPGVVAQTFEFDGLHVLELGVTSHAIGNAIADLAYDVLPGTKSKALASLNKEIVNLYSDLAIRSDCRVPPLEFSNFCSSRHDYPVLHGVKARETRYFVPVVLALCLKYETADVYTKHRTAALRALDHMYRIIDAHPLFFPDKDQAVFKEQVETFLAHYSWLAKQAMDAGLNKWSVVPKHHYTAHLPDQTQFLALRASWTYGGESIVGRISALFQASSAGTAAHKTTKPVIGKYRIAMNLRLTLQLCSSDA